MKLCHLCADNLMVVLCDNQETLKKVIKTFPGIVEVVYLLLKLSIELNRNSILGL